MSSFSGKSKGGSSRSGSGNNVVPIRPTRQVIDPYVCMDDSFRDFGAFCAGLESNNGLVRQQLDRFQVAPQGAGDIERVSYARREDHSVGLIETRYSCKPTPKNPRPKAYRITYSADIKFSNDPNIDGAHGLACQWKLLANLGLLVPTRAPQLHKALDTYVNDSGPRPLILWCEGEKTRAAIDARCERHADLFVKAGVIPVASAWLCGMEGAKTTNFALQPMDSVDRKYVVQGKNARRLDLPTCLSTVVLDNDASGRSEGMEVAERMIREYRVARSDVSIVEPPDNVLEGWDDADDLPSYLTDRERAASYLSATPYDGWWEVIRIKGGQLVINLNSVDNRMRALRRIGKIGDCYQDWATAKMIIGGGPWNNEEFPNEHELFDLAYDAIRKMEASPTVDQARIGWMEPLVRIVRQSAPKDTIHEEYELEAELGRRKADD